MSCQQGKVQACLERGELFVYKGQKRNGLDWVVILNNCLLLCIGTSVVYSDNITLRGQENFEQSAEYSP